MNTGMAERPLVLSERPVAQRVPKAGLAKRQRLASLHGGDVCPNCRSERLDYDGLLNLTCPRCGNVVGGCFT